ncbi:DUF222 domain-containing protein [Microbacterium kunmingense]|uniref:DUF222 domain-containing protein n=1 Tax=Microbacterium kunmingense TaxID=2915939 RepID=UPI002003951A|nr:DUF222 domain-containing protein [Microbacterium kunmingense]
MSSTVTPEVFEGDDELVALVAGIERTTKLIAAAQAEQSRYLAGVGQLAQRLTASSPQNVRDHDMLLRSYAAEIGGVLRVSDRTVQARIGRARVVAEDYPATLEAWEAGRIGPGHVTVITDLGAGLPPEARARFEETALVECEATTPGRARQALQLLAEKAMPESMGTRHRRAREARTVRLLPLPDGMSEMVSILPTVVAAGSLDRITEMARTIIDHREASKRELKTLRKEWGDGLGQEIRGMPDEVRERREELELIASDTRTLDQIRADILGQLLVSGVPDGDPTAAGDGPGILGGIRGRVQVVVAATTLLGADDDAADLVGKSPVDPETAREMAGSPANEWERVLTHPVTGAVVAVDTYRRPKPMDRLLKARDRTCRFPGCIMPAIRCDCDHTDDHHHGGETSTCNQAHLCRRHHSLKHHTRWEVRQLHGGILEWTSPLGRVYTDTPPPPTVMVSFRPSDDTPAPF